MHIAYVSMTQKSNKKNINATDDYFNGLTKKVNHLIVPKSARNTIFLDTSHKNPRHYCTYRTV